MKVSTVVLAALTATVIASSCTKPKPVVPTNNQETTTSDSVNNTNHGNGDGFQCPACGMG